jgi:hypothetical protein
MRKLVVLMMLFAGAGCGRAALSWPDGGLVQCGGFGGLSCPAGSECQDNPADQCRYGVDADCGGLCYPK